MCFDEIIVVSSNDYYSWIYLEYKFCILHYFLIKTVIKTHISTSRIYLIFLSMTFSHFFIFTISSFNFKFYSYGISLLVLGYVRDLLVNHSKKSQCFYLHDPNIALEFCNVVDTTATICTPHLQYFDWHFTFSYLLNPLPTELVTSMEAIFKLISSND